MLSPPLGGLIFLSKNLKKKGKVKSIEDLIVKGEGLGPLCQNHKVSSLFDKGLPWDLGSSFEVCSQALRDSTAL